MIQSFINATSERELAHEPLIRHSASCLTVVVKTSVQNCRISFTLFNYTSYQDALTAIYFEYTNEFAFSMYLKYQWSPT